MKPSPPELSLWDRRVILAAAFLGWLCAGVEMGLGPLAARPAVRDLLFRTNGVQTAQLNPTQETQVGEWFAWYLCAFLLGGAAGGVLFGRLGDKSGRVRAMGLSILCFSVLTGASWFAATPAQLLALRFLASLGIGGMWPTAVALASEAWPEASRPMIAGVIGAAANIGILLMALVGEWIKLTPDSWRWAMVIGTTPAILGVIVIGVVPESPRWLAQSAAGHATAQNRPLVEIFRPPLLRRTMLGILLGTIPLLGTWASGKWMIPWADAEGVSAARTQAIWAAGAVLGSAAGGWLANVFGRRTTYFLVSLGALIINVAIYRVLHPTHPGFEMAVFLLGLVATVFFGWLPLYLPELFPTRNRATGTGVTFNIGRVASAGGVLAAGGLMSLFNGNYAKVGEVTAWVYAVGMVIILLAPDTSKSTMQD